jgi:manganese oxidase
MTMDEVVEKPETLGLRKGWTAGMMGMMTLIRVVSPALFEQIAERRRAQAGRAV